ncbi:MAG TPA: carboxypeptidase regulatory-like domain-containing protein [Polyangiaceae bacterium]|nr:carboxypeptidase regulatory-like domain-containing protein [Polyangiaceae bacterium]
MLDPLAGAGGSVERPPVNGGAPSTPPGAPNPDDGFIVDPTDVPVGMEAPEGTPLRRRGLIDKQVTCEGDATTTVSGTVYIPSGKLPLYNVMVYVPETELAPLPQGVSCNCEVSGEPIVSALTDSSGHFVLQNVPVGPDIPVVIQVGDWRREINIGTVEPCVDTPVADGTLTFPKNQSEGDMPKIAVTTGRLDALECLVRKLGVDDSEFTNEREGGRVQLFTGQDGTDRFKDDLANGESFPPAQALWDDVNVLKQYDIVLLSCEGDEPPAEDEPLSDVPNKTEASMQAMFDYANAGGRIFASHFQAIWFQRGPQPFPELATFTYGNDSEYNQITAQVVTGFPKGDAMEQWIVNTGTSADGQVAINGGAHTILAENTRYAQRWLETSDPPSVQYISANTPLGASDADQCGRVVLSDLHVSPGFPEGDFSDQLTDFPDGCITDTFSPQEAVLAFMLFDLSACIVPDNQAPVAPPVIR